VENAAPMRGLKRAGDLEGEANAVALGQRATKRRALDVLEHQVVGADVEDLTDIGMTQRGDRARFLLETAHTIGIRGEDVRQDLECHVTIQPRVARPIDLAHAAGAERSHDFIGTETRARCQGHGG
jgi:hypothetical protein